VIDFGILPPEITSALIHSGPGAWSLIDAAAVWQELSLELEQALNGYTMELSALTAVWQGPSSAALTEAVQPYLAWLATTAQQCQEIAASMGVVTTAFELTHWTVVHPSVVAANRTRLAALIATNFFGVNLPAIAETEAEYNAMWVNNSAAMYRYAGTSLAAVKLPTFSPAPSVTNPSGTATQAAVVPAATGSTRTAAAAVDLAAGDDAAGIFGSDGDPSGGWFGYWSTWGWQTIAGGLPINLLSYLAQFSTAQSLQGVGGDIAQGLAEGSAALASAEARLVGALSSAGSSLLPRASMGISVLVGKLSMPPAAVSMLPGVQATPVQLASAVSPLPSGPSSLSGVPLAPLRSGAGKGGRRGGRDYDDIEIGAEIPGTVVNGPPSAG
jgi:PPE-repeat protein